MTHYSLFDKALEKAAVQYNNENDTNFDPVEARHQYLEMCEAQPNPFMVEQVEVNLDDLVVVKPAKRSIH
jgi:hypothetical protein